MEEATPRGMIRGVLSTASVSRSTRNLNPRKRPRTARETPVNPPSHAEVATRILTRSRSTNKRNTASGVQTPKDSTTPRTLIAGYLKTAPVAASVVRVKKQRTVKKGRIQADNDTPRAIIQNVLREALVETPEKPIQSPDVEDVDMHQQTNETETSSSLMTSITNDQDKSVDGQVAMTTIDEADVVTTIEATTKLLDSYEEDENAVQRASGQEESQELGALSSVVSAQIVPTETLISDDAQTSRQWRDLVTPKLPLNFPSAAVTNESNLTVSGTERSSDERPFFGGKPPAGKVVGKSSKKPSGPKLPSARVKNIFQHFSKAKVSKEAFQAVENGSNLFFKRVSSDLMTYCQHAHRSTIELADVELLMKRQGFINDRESLYSLVEEYLPLEYRQEIIPTVQAGNKIVLK